LPSPGAQTGGIDALTARLAGALATHIASHGLRRLGICSAAPCTCVFVDHTRPRTRKYCCDQCNDGAATAAYYQRKRASIGLSIETPASQVTRDGGAGAGM
jgi:predicted RNA-binding Zn ribbon-like protein